MKILLKIFMTLAQYCQIPSDFPPKHPLLHIFDTYDMKYVIWLYSGNSLSYCNLEQSSHEEHCCCDILFHNWIDQPFGV